MKDRPKVLVIGLDGATWDLIKPWAEEGELPTIKKLMDSGVYGTMLSVLPTESGANWSSFFTGKNPGKHGIIGFYSNTKNRPYNYYDISKVGHVYEILSMAGFKIGFMNFPLDFPPPKLEGFIVSGFLAPNLKEASSDNTVYYILSKNNYNIDILTSIVGKCNRKKILELSRKSIRSRTKSFLELLNIYTPDFCGILFNETDILQHWYFNDEELIKSIFRELDNAIKEIFQNISDNNTYIIIVSDHGFKKMPHRAVNLKYLFTSIGLIETNKLKLIIGKLRYLVLSMANIFSKTFKVKVDLRITRSIREKLNKAFYHVSKKSVIKGKIDNLLFLQFGISIRNLDDMQIDTIIELLRHVKDPKTGERVFIDVFRREDYFTGPYVEDMPDIIFIPNKCYKVVWSDLPVLFFDTYYEKEQGSHDFCFDGILIACGPNIKKGERVDAKIYDIAPTILHIFGLPIPNDMDGRVLMEIFKPDSEIAKRRPVYVDPSYYRKDTEKERLKLKIKELKLKGKI